jgi:hypothetical protein
MQKDEIYKTIQDMVRAHPLPQRDFAIWTGSEGRKAINKAMRRLIEQDEPHDSDFAKFCLKLALSEGMMLNIKMEQGEMVAKLGKQYINGDRNHKVLTDLIEPHMVRLRSYIDTDFIKPEKNQWISHRPGVTKIKIKQIARNWYRCTVKHKMGRDGGKNYFFEDQFTLISNIKQDGKN